MKDPQADVVVIGGGAAGMAAALRLAQRGRQVILLEARGRLGGRMLTEYPRGLRTPVELGAEFVHGGNASLRAALRLAGLRLQLINDDFWLFQAGELRAFPDYWETIGVLTAKIPAKTRGSFQDFLRHHPELPRFARHRAKDFLEGFNAAPAEKLSAKSVRADHGGVEAPQYRLPAGYGALVDSLRGRLRASGVQIQFNAVVTKVQWRRGSVAITCGKTQYLATRAIITLPLGILKAGTVKFSPPLPEKQRLVRAMGWGNVTRVSLRFKRGLWSSRLVPQELRQRGRASFGFINAPGESVPVWWVPHPGEPLIVGWAGGPKADALGKFAPAGVYAAATRSLAHIWQQPLTRVRAQVTDWWMHDWRRDSFARGAYSFAVAGKEDGPQQLAEPVGNTLFFAGEATADEIGTVHGALASGQRAADEILEVGR